MLALDKVTGSPPVISTLALQIPAEFCCGFMEPETLGLQIWILEIPCKVAQTCVLRAFP